VITAPSREADCDTIPAFLAFAARLTSRSVLHTRVAMGKRTRDRQPTMWVPTTELPTAASHPFYRRLNQLLPEHGFDDFVEEHVELSDRPKDRCFKATSICEANS
jgi:hypothetical protein